MSLVTHRCWCSVEHAIPEELDRQARQSGHSIYCPLGHQWVMRNSENDNLRRERDRLKQENARIAGVAFDAEVARSKAENALKRHKKRAAAGTCPCCNRTFSNMARHMKSEHPNFNVVPLREANG